MTEYVCTICGGEFTDNTKPEEPVCDDCKLALHEDEEESEEEC